MTTLDLIVRQGKALYVGISNYKSGDAVKAFSILKQLGTPCLINQPRYSMLDRWVEKDGLLDVLEKNGVGCISFSPLAQGLLTNRYINGIPEGSRATKGIFLKQEQITEEVFKKITTLNKIALERNQSLAQMALAWLLKDNRVTSVLIGASSSVQLLDSVQCLMHTSFSKEELDKIDGVLNNF
jgi:L-glyceraldehyde 3-phosphate reductase